MSSLRSIARAAARGNRRTPKSATRNIRTSAHCSSHGLNLRGITRRVYVASSLSTYNTPEYERNLQRIAELLPKAEILAPRDLFTSHADWLEKWPGIVSQIDALVFFEDAGGYIGYGVWTELNDAVAHGIPIRRLAPNGKLYEISADDGEIETIAFRPWDLRQFAMIAYKMPASEALALLQRPAPSQREHSEPPHAVVLPDDGQGGA